MDTTAKILAKKSELAIEGEDWMQRLWDWADENEIDLPRNKKELIRLSKLRITCNLTELPKEIGQLVNLTELRF